MRIGVDVRALDTPYVSGVDTYLRALLNVWTGISGHKFLLFGTPVLENDPSIMKMVQAGHSFFSQNLPNKVFNAGMKFLRAPKMDKLVGGADVFWMPNPMFHATSGNVKKVVTFHDLSFERLKFIYSLKRNLWHFLVNPKKEARGADALIAVSSSTASDLEKLYGINSEKIKVVPLGVDNEKFLSPTPNSFLSTLNVDRSGYILFLGNLEPRKNVSTLVRAFNEVKLKHQGLKIVLAGSFFPQKDKALLREVKNHKDIIVLGKASEGQKIALYQNAKMMVLPSLYEGFGLPILEAFSAGTPVVTSSSSSMPEVSNGAALIVNPLNIKDMASAIQLLLTNSSLKDNLISRGKEVSGKYSWEKTAKMTLEVLEAAALYNS